MASKDDIRKEAEHNALMREVDEELRRDQIAKLWEQYGTYMLAVAAAIVIGVGGYKWWDGRQRSAAMEAGARYADAARLAEEGKTDEAQKALQSIAKSGPRSYAVLSDLRLAGADAKAGRTAEAIATYEALAARSGVDPLFADFARLQTASLKLDTADWTEMQNRLNPLAGDASPWRYSARELIGLAALKAGRTEDARSAYEQLLADRRVPQAIGERARMMMGMIVEKELAKGAAATVPTAEPPAKAAEPAPNTPEPKKK